MWNCNNKIYEEEETFGHERKKKYQWLPGKRDEEKDRLECKECLGQ